MEVMQLSKLEDQKKKGALNLDFLKRKNKEKKGAEELPPVAQISISPVKPPSKRTIAGGNGQIIDVVPKNLVLSPMT